MIAVIYVIRNTQNNKRYVGSTADLAKRWAIHRRQLNNNQHHCQHLQYAWNKYGEELFVLEILEHIDNLDALIPREQVYIDQFATLRYNSSPTAGSPRGVKRSALTKQKLSDAHKGRPLTPEHRESIRQALLGRTFTKEWLAKIQAAKVGQKRSPETCRHISEALRGRKIDPAVVNRIADANRGQKRSPETRQKMRQAQRRPELRQRYSDRAQLAWEDVLAMYKAYGSDRVSLRKLAQRFDISYSYVRTILHGKKRPPDLCPDKDIRQQLLQYTFTFNKRRTRRNLE